MTNKISNLEALRLLARTIPMVPNIAQRSSVAYLGLLAVTAPTDRERDAALLAARRILRAALPPEDRAA